MKRKCSLTLAMFAIGALAPVGAGDVIEGSVLAVDRKARTLVLTDRSVWSLEGMRSELPAGLQAGDRIRIDFEGSEDGVEAINAISLVTAGQSAAESSMGANVTIGTVLVYDRKAKLVVLTDRTVWALDALKSGMPAGLDAGDRITIRYQADEDGVSSIDRIEILAR